MTKTLEQVAEEVARAYSGALTDARVLQLSGFARGAFAVARGVHASVADVSFSQFLQAVEGAARTIKAGRGWMR